MKDLKKQTTREELLTTLGITEEEFKNYLQDCQIPDTNDPEVNYEYKEEDLNLLLSYQNIIKKELSKQFQKLKKDKKPLEAIEILLKTQTKEKEEFLITHLIERAIEVTGKPISLSQTGEMLKLAGVAEKIKYSAQEVAQFIEVIDSIFNKGISYTEVAAQRGISLKEEDLLSIVKKIGAEQSQELIESFYEVTIERNKKLLQTENQFFLQELSKAYAPEGTARKTIRAERDKVVNQILNTYILEAIDVTEIYGESEKPMIAPSTDENK